MVAIKRAATHLKGKLVHLYSDSATMVAIFQVGRGRDPYIQACVRELWLTCSEHESNIRVSHTPEEALTGMANVLNHWPSF